MFLCHSCAASGNLFNPRAQKMEAENNHYVLLLFARKRHPKMYKILKGFLKILMSNTPPPSECHKKTNEKLEVQEL